METIDHAREEKRDNNSGQPNGNQGAYAIPPVPAAPDASDETSGVSSDSSVSDREQPEAPLLTRHARSGENPQVVLSKGSDMPAVGPGADLARVRVPWRSAAICFAVTFVVYLAFIVNFLRYSNPPTGDQVYYMMDTITLVQDHDLLLNNNYQDQDYEKFYKLAPHPGGFVGMLAPDPLPPMNANASARPPEEMYSYHLPGLAVWMIPSWLIGGIFQLWWPACIVFMILVGSLVALNVFLFAHELTGKPWIAWLVWASVAFVSPLMTYSYLIFTELPVGLLLIYSFRRLALGWSANGPYRLLLVGLAIANIPWIAWRCLPIAALLGLYALVQWWRYRRARSAALGDQPWETRFPAYNNGSIGWFALLAAPVVALGALLVLYNIYIYGRIIPDNSVLEQGRIAVFHYPWMSTDDARAFVSAIFGQLFDRGFGLLPYAPIYVLAFVGIVAAFYLGGSYRRLLFWVGLLSLPYLVIICSFDSWNGVWCPPARYLTTFAPFMAGLLALSLFALQRSTFYKVLYALLAIPGWVIMWVLLGDPRLFWPTAQGGAYLQIQLFLNLPSRVNLSGIFPIFSPLDDLTHPIDTGWMTALTLAITLFCYLLMRFQGRPRQGPSKSWPYPAQGATWAVVLVVVGLGWLFMNYDFIKHRTTFTQVGQWPIPTLLDEAYGITYLDSKIYVSSYARNTTGIVGAFDLKTHYFQAIEPSGTASTQFFHVGDVKVGPDGKLYVLNNGVGPNALWVMTPDGHVEQTLELQNKTPIATALNFGPDGNIYVSDMLGGRILKYPPYGGGPLGIYAGESSGFNNPSGVAVAPNGTIYAAEQGFQRLQVLASDGKFIRNVGLGCKPTHVTVSGDFLDVTCDKGLVSVNWKTNSLQLAHFEPPYSKPQSPTGLTYGPGNVLFVLDGNFLHEYKVQH